MIVYVLRTGPASDIEAVEFEVLSPEMIRSLSVVEVKDAMIYSRGIPTMFGINDVRMGTVDRRLMCCTCGRDVKNCQGHTGHIDLPATCYHIGFLDVVLKTLRSVCFCCSSLCLTEEEKRSFLSLPRKSRFAAAYASARTGRACESCGAPRPAYTKTAAGAIRMECAGPFESAEEEAFFKQPFTAAHAKSVLSCISARDREVLGFGRTLPSSLLMDTVVVPPTSARPAIMVSEGSRARGQDDLTHKLQDINKRCIEIRAALRRSGAAPPETPDCASPFDSDVSEKLARLQLEVSSFMHSGIKAPKRQNNRSSVILKSVTDRLKGKEGRIRGNLMGKRVDQSARSVITPDAIMDPDEVGVPEAIAVSVTVPERVTASNICALTARVRLGPGTLGGAECIVCGDGGLIHLSLCQSRHNLRLQIGWTVERYLQDGDYVIFNRQPSLHRMGMMGHKVHVMPGKTFRLNLCCANPYNADFDGDEMNMHVCQSFASVSEVAHIMSVPQQVISPASNKPCMGIVQDTLLGAYLMTRDDVLIGRSLAMRLAGWIKHPHGREGGGGGWALLLPRPAVVFPAPLWTGRQVFSLLLDPLLSYSRGEVVVRRGRLLAGTLSKQTLGTSAGSLVDHIYRQRGSRAALRFMGDIQRVVNQWLLARGFSVGIGDCALSEEGKEVVRQRVDAATRSVAAIETDPAAPEHPALVEGTALTILSKVLMGVGAAVEGAMGGGGGGKGGGGNAISAMVAAGSKGNPINLSQICGCVGQQCVEGGRVCAPVRQSQSQSGMGVGRTISAFLPGSKEVEASGFVASPYAKGLRPSEYFFHAMGGREGLVDTAVKTATTGYIQRRLIKGMEDNSVAYDGSVRTAEGDIVQFLYGADGGDPTKLERVRLEELGWPAERLAEAVGGGEDAARVLALREEVWRARSRGGRRAVDDAFLTPFNLAEEARAVEEGGGAGRTSAAAARRRLDALCADVAAAAGSAEASAPLRLCLCARLPPRRAGARFSPPGLDRLCAALLARVRHSRVGAGEMVGSIAAQSIGEPCTQMTLNTFHLAGVGNALTLGVPRFKELIDLSKRIRTPSMRLPLRGALGLSRSFAEGMAATVVDTKLGDLVAATTFHREERGSCAFAEDQFYVDLRRCVHGDEPAFGAWVARMVLRKEAMQARRLTPPRLRQVLEHHAEGKVQWTSSETNSLEWVLRMRIAVSEAALATVGPVLDREKVLIHRVHAEVMDKSRVCGLPGVTAAAVRDVEVPLSPSEAETRHVVETHGIALGGAACCGAVDVENATVNDVCEAYALLGVEAAVGVLFDEIETTISFDGTYVDKRHIMQVVDTMTRRGYVMALSRHGINKLEHGPLMRSSFEETVDVMYDAATHNATDGGKGVTQSIMTGQLARIGTGSFSVRTPKQGTGEARREARRSLCKSTVRAPTLLALWDDTVEYVTKGEWEAKGDSAPKACARPYNDDEEEGKEGAPFRLQSFLAGGGVEARVDGGERGEGGSDCGEEAAAAEKPTSGISMEELGREAGMGSFFGSYRPPSPEYDSQELEEEGEETDDDGTALRGEGRGKRPRL